MEGDNNDAVGIGDSYTLVVMMLSQPNTNVKVEI